MTALLVASVSGSPSSQEAEELERLLASLVLQDVPVRLVLAVRGASTCPVPVPTGLSVATVALPAATSLSRSRNAALAHARTAPWWEGVTCVAFADDDCWYPAGSLKRALAGLRDADVVCGRYGPDADRIDASRFPAGQRQVTPSLVVRSVSSITMFWRRSAVDAVGTFDERLGVGALYGSSEDVDLVLRALAAGLRIEYQPQVVVCHEYRAAWPSSYYVGNCAVLAKHRSHPAVRVLLLRRLIGGAVLVLRRRLAVREAVVAWRAVRAVGRDPLAPIVTTQDGGSTGLLSAGRR